MNNSENAFMQYMEYLYSIGCTLDENGNIVPLNDQPKKLSLIYATEDDEDE